MSHLRVALPLLLLAACRFAGLVSTPLDTSDNTTIREVAMEKTTDGTPLITPGHSIRLPGKGVGTWKEISLSRPRENKARYTDAEKSSSNIFKASNIWVTTLLVAWKHLSEILNLSVPF